MWFPHPDTLFRVAAVGLAVYLTLLVLLRLSGARALAKMRAFDFTVTVAIGSLLATGMVSADLTYLGAALAMGLLLAAQWLMAQGIRRSPVLRRIATADPVVLVREGEVLEEGLRRARVGRTDVHQAARGAGLGDLSDVAAMIMETDGTVSVISRDAFGSGAAVAELEGWARGDG